MAFATLPYPSIDFVPLDVLTADELDQLVANINAVNNGSVSATAIVDGSITGAKLASGAITETKIDDGAVSVNKVASNAITTAKVADGAITGAKINVQSIGSKVAEAGTAVSIGTTDTELINITLDAGSYALIGRINLNHVNSRTGDSYIKFYNKTAGQNVGYSSNFDMVADGTYNFNVVATALVVLTAQSVIAIYGKKSEGTLNSGGGDIIAIRIA